MSDNFRYEEKLFGAFQWNIDYNGWTHIQTSYQGLQKKLFVLRNPSLAGNYREVTFQLAQPLIFNKNRKFPRIRKHNTVNMSFQYYIVTQVRNQSKFTFNGLNKYAQFHTSETLLLRSKEHLTKLTYKHSSKPKIVVTMNRYILHSIDFDNLLYPRTSIWTCSLNVKYDFGMWE